MPILEKRNVSLTAPAALTPGGSNVQAAPEEPARMGIIISAQTGNAAPIFVNFGSAAASAANGFAVAAGTVVVITAASAIYNGPIQVFGTTTDKVSVLTF